jgi:hypothetical protein
LHVSGTEAKDTITVKGTTVWIDPEGVETTQHYATETLTVTGAKQIIWPVPDPDDIAPVTP